MWEYCHNAGWLHYSPISVLHLSRFRKGAFAELDRRRPRPPFIVLGPHFTAQDIQPRSQCARQQVCSSWL
jgi:hypothetical protein